MSTIATKDKYHVALNGVGFILEGAPDSPAYSQSQVPIYGQRFASGDRSYDDLSQFWFFAQTDFSGGFLNVQTWEDTFYYYSSNIDSWSVPGTLRLVRGKTDEFGVSSPIDIMCGTYGVVGGNEKLMMGSDDDTDDIPNFYVATAWPGNTWTETVGSNLDTSCVAISQILVHKDYAFLLCYKGTAASVTDAVNSWDGATTFADKSSDLATALAGTLNNCRTGCIVDTDMYLFTDDSVGNTFGIVKTSVQNPAAAGDWTVVYEETNTKVPAIDCKYYNGSIYHLRMNRNTAIDQMELWAYNIADDVETRVKVFENATHARRWGLGGKLLHVVNGKLVILIPPYEIWETDGTDLIRIYQADPFKTRLVTGVTQTEKITNGGVMCDNKLWMSNLMYDGEVFHNTFRVSSDSDSAEAIPFFAAPDGYLFFGSTADRDIKSINLFSTALISSYRSTADKNFIVFGPLETIASVDKLFHGVTIIFDKLTSGQSIGVEYSTGEIESGMTWTALGTASQSVDGSTITSKFFRFGDSVIGKKLWFRVKLLGGGTDTPVVKDFICEYLPFPIAKKQWQLRMNLGDELKRLDGGIVDKTGRELRSLLEGAWWTKSILDFQDLDYAETALNGALDEDDTSITVDSTDDFPEQGRIKIENEEITYTSKTKFKFNGCTRGARDTKGVTHSDNVAVTNVYKVIVTSYATQVPTALEGKNLEYIASVSLREV